jgi:hypothetical protein
MKRRKEQIRKTEFTKKAKVCSRTAEVFMRG